jgi:predicted peptidase
MSKIRNLKQKQNLRILTIFLIVGLITSAAYVTSSAAEFSGQELKLPFRLFKPDDPSDSKQATKNNDKQLLVFLHGSGERGSDNEAQLKHGRIFFERLAQENNTLVLVPQCPEKLSWHNGYSKTSKRGRTYWYPKKIKPNRVLDLLERLVDSVAQAENIAPSNLLIGGLSMGGMGTLELLRRRSQYYKRAFVICGGAHRKVARQIGDTPIWFFHGQEDEIVLPKYAQRLFRKLKRKGRETIFTLYPGVNHNSWDLAFREQELIPWLTQ